ncbi:hypothetical protein ACOSP7_003633 [Xanthoceras sorbifolium]
MRLSLLFVLTPEKQILSLFFFFFLFPSLLAVWQRKRGGAHTAPKMCHTLALWGLCHVEIYVHGWLLFNEFPLFSPPSYLHCLPLFFIYIFLLSGMTKMPL